MGRMRQFMGRMRKKKYEKNYVIAFVWSLDQLNAYIIFELLSELCLEDKEVWCSFWDISKYFNAPLLINQLLKLTIKF